MIIFQSPASRGSRNGRELHWLLLSDAGQGGLAEPTSPDFSVSRDAMAADSHIEVGDYVLLYANKRCPNSVVDRRSGGIRTVFTDTSTWTWKIRRDLLREIRLATETCCRTLDFGKEPTNGLSGTGLQGLLAVQRSRPLFSGVRNQVIDLYRYAAETAWPPYRQSWLAEHPRLAATLGPAAGALRPLRDMMQHDLPTMSQHRLYTVPPTRVRDVLAQSMAKDTTVVL